MWDFFQSDFLDFQDFRLEDANGTGWLCLAAPKIGKVFLFFGHKVHYRYVF